MPSAVENYTPLEKQLSVLCLVEMEGLTIGHQAIGPQNSSSWAGPFRPPSDSSHGPSANRHLMQVAHPGSSMSKAGEHKQAARGWPRLRVIHRCSPPSTMVLSLQLTFMVLWGVFYDQQRKKKPSLDHGYVSLVCANWKGMAATLPLIQGWQEILPVANIMVVHLVTHFVWRVAWA